jgi:hypothetical protein
MGNEVNHETREIHEKIPRFAGAAVFGHAFGVAEDH